MSISAIDSTGVSGTGLTLQQMVRGSQKSPDEMTAFIVEKDDADGDGLLSLKETPLDEDRFNAIDADGNGFISAEELSADAQQRMEDKNAMMGQLSCLMQEADPDEMAASIFERDDADGDGLLSLKETSLDEDRFNSIDTDGDGFITAEELSTHMQENAAQGAPPTGQGMETQAASASGSGSDESESDEEYDEYDLNKDGVVTIDELLQAYQGGDTSLSSLFQGMDDSDVSAQRQRMAMEAYQTQLN